MAGTIGENFQRPAARNVDADATRDPRRIRLDQVAGVEPRAIQCRGDCAARFISTRHRAKAEFLRAFAQIRMPDPAPAMFAHLTSILCSCQIALAWKASLSISGFSLKGHITKN